MAQPRPLRFGAALDAAAIEVLAQSRISFDDTFEVPRRQRGGAASFHTGGRTGGRKRARAPAKETAPVADSAAASLASLTQAPSPAAAPAAAASPGSIQAPSPAAVPDAHRQKFVQKVRKSMDTLHTALERARNTAKHQNMLVVVNKYKAALKRHMSGMQNLRS